MVFGAFMWCMDPTRTEGGPFVGPPASVWCYRLLPLGGLLPRLSPLGLPVVDGALGGLDEPLAIGLLLAML